MTYKKQLVFLLTLISILALFYTFSIVFSYDRSSVKTALYTWLEPETAVRINRIVFNTGWEEFELIKRNNQWFVSHNGGEFPARQARIEDFLNILTARSAWPVRSANAATHNRFGLGEYASRLTIYDNFSVLLDLLVGDYDLTGNEAYFRRAGQNEVRSGDSFILTYMTSPVESWYDVIN